jgi:glycosyltransferase involved in cell wall biosynthesis
MPRRRLLVVAYLYPPVPSVGANRWSAAVKHLRRLGHEVTVVTTSAHGGLPDDGTGRVVRARDLNTATALRALLRRPPLTRPGETEQSLEKPPPGVLTKVVVPDAYTVSWAPFAYLAVRRIVRRQPIDCVITTSPTESAHLIALALGGSRPAWLADFRDGWTFERLRPPFPTAMQRSIDERLERAVVSHADAVVGVTLPIADDLRRRFGVDAAYVPNGWDGDIEPEIGRAAPRVSATPGRFLLAHTGSMSTGGRDPGPLFDALVTLRRSEPEIAARLELVVAGRLSPTDRRLVDTKELDGVVRHVGMLPRDEALALQRSADALLLVTSRQSGEATGKLFEYLAAGRPILALAHENAAAGIVQETGTGRTVAPDDVPGIVSALKSAVEGGLDADYRPRGLERYRYPGIADALVEQVELAISRRASRAAIAR